MKASEIRAYKKRWELVAAVEQVELARMSPAQKFAEVGMLMDVARTLGPSTDDEADVEQVRRRWVLLAQRRGAREPTSATFALATGTPPA
ncbi:MAG: hypothetical protein ABJE95_25940 [Byssovorax sp.]